MTTDFFARRPAHRAEHLGAMLRPQIVQQARYYASPPDELRQAEDEAICRLVKLQKQIGLKVISDGEVRRSYGHHDFISALGGVGLHRPEQPRQAHEPPMKPVLAGALAFPADHPMLDHFRFVKKKIKAAEGIAKVSLPSPAALLDLLGGKARTGLAQDMAQCYRDALKAFHAAGCRYVVIDDRDRRLPPEFRALLLEEAIKDRAPDLMIGLRMHRDSNAQAADSFFNRSSVDIYATACFDILPFLPKGRKRVLLEAISMQNPQLETLDDLRRLVEHASRLCDIDQLGLASDLGQSPVGVDPVSPDHQKQKLTLLSDAAQMIWGEQ